MAKRIIVWQSYLDPSISRKYGRRVPKSLLPSRVTVEDILKACREIGIECEIMDKKYPRTWHLGHKAVEVNYEGSKSKLLKELAKTLQRICSRDIASHQ
jgi:signal recognition particle subunit SRP19